MEAGECIDLEVETDLEGLGGSNDFTDAIHIGEQERFLAAIEDEEVLLCGRPSEEGLDEKEGCDEAGDKGGGDEQDGNEVDAERGEQRGHDEEVAVSAPGGEGDEEEISDLQCDEREADGDKACGIPAGDWDGRNGAGKIAVEQVDDGLLHEYKRR